MKAELAVLSRMRAASIYGKEMTDSCSGNTDNKREERRRCRGRRGGRKNREKEKEGKEKEGKKGKKKNCRRYSRCIGALAQSTPSPWQQAGGREAVAAVALVRSARRVPINLLRIKRHQPRR